MTVDVYVDNTVTTRIPPQLIKSDIAGKGAAQIGWGSPGDFDRCLAFARRHGIPKRMQKGFCANLHKLATGEWPGRNAHKSAHSLAIDYLIASMGTYSPITWEGPLAAIEQATGDRRRFPRDTLKYQTFPQPFRWQEHSGMGHNGAVVVGVIEDAKERDVDGKRVVWAHGYFLDPTIVPQVNRAVHELEHGVTGPSVDLDSYTAVLKKNALSGETVADMLRGRQRAATLVSVPAFADLRIKVTRPDAAIVASGATFAVNPGGWRGAPIAPREALFDADDAAKRIEAWANGDPAKMAKMFLWIADSPNDPLIGRSGYRLPWGDIIDDKPYLIYHAVYAAAALLQDAHGGLPAIPDEQKGKLRTVITEIYEELASEFNDPSVIAPWDRQAAAQQASGPPPQDPGGDEYDAYLAAFDAALQEFRGRYTEAKHPRDRRKNDHAGEWVDVPKHDAHGRIKVGSKWVYPPKKGEKGYRSPEQAVRGIAKRGGGSATKRGGRTRVVKKASPDKGSVAPVAVKKVKDTDDHVAALRRLNRQRQKRYLGGLSDDEINKINNKMGGTRLDDDTRDDVETEIIHRLSKTGEAEQAQRRKDERTKERDSRVREIAHDEEGRKKTIVAKKKPETKAPEKTGGSDADREELKQRRQELKQINTMISNSEQRGGKDSKRHKDLLEEREALQRDIDDLESRVGTKAPEKKVVAKKTATKAPEKKTPEKKASETKAPSVSERLTLRSVRDSGDEGLIKSKMAPGAKEQVDDLVERGLLERRGRGRYHITDKGRESLKGHESEEPQAKKTTTKAPEKKTVVVRKKTGEPKEHKLTDSQQRGLEDIRDGGKAHPASRKVLEREGYLDSDGNLTQKGKDHLGIKGETKVPEKKTTVAKKTPKTLDDVRGELDQAKTRDEADAILANVRGQQLKDLARSYHVPVRGTVGDIRISIRERTVGNRLNSKAIREGAVKKTTSEVLKERREARNRENLEFFSKVDDEDKAVQRLRTMNRSELIATFAGIQRLGGTHDPKWSDDELRENILRIIRYDIRDRKRLTDLADRRKRLKAYPERVERADREHRQAVSQGRTRNPRAVSGTYSNTWDDILTEDTGPLGVPVENLTFDSDNTSGGYHVAHGRLIRRNGISYLIEDGPDVMADEVADHLESIHRGLPGGDKYLRAYAWMQGNSPDDDYWKKRFGNPDHVGAASSGDGIMRFWKPGVRTGFEGTRRLANHEFGHNVDSVDARPQGIGSKSQTWQARVERDSHVPFPIGWQWDGVRMPPSKTRGASSREVVWGVSDYGKSSWGEDFAESTDMYLRGPIGTAPQGMGGRVHVYFRDLFPGRTQILDLLFPDIAEKQKELIRLRGPLTYV